MSDEIVLGYEYRGPHHIRPTSRCLIDEEGNIYPNIVYPEERWPPEKLQHIHWHILFVNLTPQEVIDKIREYTNEDGTLNEEFFAFGFTVVEKWEGAGIRTDEVIIKEQRYSKRIEKKKEAWRIVFGAMNACEAIDWIIREFIFMEWLPALEQP